MSRAALLINTDIIRLYRKLRDAGVTFPRMRLRLHEDLASLRSVGLRLIRRGMAQTVPEADLAHEGRHHLAYHIPAPDLARLPILPCEYHSRIIHPCRQYSRYPVRVLVTRVAHLEIYSVRLDLWALEERWYAAHHSLCGLWDDLHETTAVITSLDMQLRAARAYSARR